MVENQNPAQYRAETGTTFKSFIDQYYRSALALKKQDNFCLPLSIVEWLDDTLADIYPDSRTQDRANQLYLQPNLVFLMVMRVKTIFLELNEMHGIQLKNDKQKNQVNFSRNYAYLDHYFSTKLSSKMIDQIVQIFATEQLFPNERKDDNKDRLPKNPDGILILHGLLGASRIVAQREQLHQLIAHMLRFDLRKALGKDIAWADLRVTKQYFQYYLNHWSTGAHLPHYQLRGNHQLDVQLVVMKELMVIEMCLTKGDFSTTKGKPESFNPNMNQFHLCHQFSKVLTSFEKLPKQFKEKYALNGSRSTSAQYLMFVRAQPRRVVIFEAEKGTVQPKVLGYATYQYLELTEKFKDSSIVHYVGRREKNINKSIQKVVDAVVTRDKERFAKNPNALHAFLPARVFQDTPPMQLRQIAFHTLENQVHVDPDGSGTIKPYLFDDAKVPEAKLGQFRRIKGEIVDTNELDPDAVPQRDAKLDKDEVKEIIEQVADEDGTKQLLRFIKSIPKIKFKLTSEQDLMISTPENLLCLGRSGTGKTTSSALRLFASDAFYKFHEQTNLFKAANPQKRLKDFLIPPKFMDSDSNLKLLFVSASPVLVNEVKRFYIDLKLHLCDQLERRQSRLQALKADDQEAAKQGDEICEGQPQPEEAKQSTEPTEQELLQKFVENELIELERDESIEQQSQIVARFDQLKPSDYPLFLTVKRLILMLDSSTRFPFFARDSQGKQVGLSGNLEWSNEQGGVFMINQYYKKQQDFEGLVQKLGEKILDLRSELEVQDQVTDQEAKGQADAQEEQPRSEENYYHGGSEKIKNADKMSLTGQNLSFEVDFDIFSIRFWPKVAQQTKVAPLVAWTEICSELKGRVDSFNYEDGGIPANLYVEEARSSKKKKSSGFLTKLEKSQIYYIFLKYEQWKQQFRAYDQNDVVNHILRQIKLDYIDRTPQMHFLMVDEVQDLTQNLISLLMTMAKKNIFFTGDTAQTIAKGVGFRFYDLKSIFDKQGNHFTNLQTVFNPPKVLQLTKNFRSHCRILDCANSVVSLLELLFPKTIDKLLKETSDIDGPKPIVIETGKNQSLAALKDILNNYLIWGADYQATQKEAQAEDSQSEKYQFGCDRVIIVRDQESKASIPDFLKNVLCLTVYEAKGLEFDEVILFNFFSDTKCGSQWKLLNEVTAEQTVVKKFVATEFLDFEMLDCEEFKDGTAPEAEEEKKEEVVPSADDNEQTTVKVDGENEISTKLHLKTEFAEVYRKFAQVCTELKLLYVAITRPKKLLLIYDEDTTLRMPIQKHWSKVGVIDVISGAMSVEIPTIPEALAKVLRIGAFRDGSEKELDPKALQMQWRVQGFKLFKAKLYMAAKQCFENSCDEALVTRCQAYECAENAMRLRGQSEAKVAFYKDKNNYLKASERNEYRQQARELLTESKSIIRQAGQFFREINMDKHAAQCFYSGDDNENAVDLFVKLGQVGQAAESYLQLGKLREAANLFARAGLFANAFECYERLEDWDGLIQCLHRYKERLEEQERVTYIDKYFPIALNSVYQLYANLDPDGAQQVGMTEDNKGKVQQMRLRLKFQKSVSIIREEVSDAEDEDIGSDSSDEQEEEKVQASPELDKEEEKVQNQEEVTKEEAPEETKQEQKSQASSEQTSFVMINTCDDDAAAATQIDQGQEEKKQESGDEDADSFQIISESDEEQDGQVTVSDEVAKPTEEIAVVTVAQNELEALSQIDPDDEFLKSEHSYSLIDKLSEKHSSFDMLSAHSSEFSILSGTNMHELLTSIKSEKSMVLGSVISQHQNASLDASSILDHLNSSKFSAVNHERDTYAEDIVIQKVIYYISLFKKDVKDALFAKRSKDQLAQLLLEVEGEDSKAAAAEVADPAAREFEEDMDFMMIELDELPSELLGLILDTLEHYELYRLCLIICGRYSLEERLGRYVAAVSQKYSNLNSQRFLTFGQPSSAAQNQLNFSLVAHEAMHNVISLASSCGQTERGIAYQQGCFETLFLHGFWKKLIYLLDVEASLQLCMATQDTESFKLNYLVEKLGIKDPKVIQSAIISPEKFKQLAIEAPKADMIDEFAADIQTQSKVSNVKTGAPYLDFEKVLKKDAPNIRNRSNVRSIADQLAIHNPRDKKPIEDRPVKLHENMRGSVKGKPHFPYRFVSYLYSIQKAMVENDLSVTRTVYQAFGISLLDGLDLFKNFSQNYCIVNKEFLQKQPGLSWIYLALSSKQLHLLSLIQNKILLEHRKPLAEQDKTRKISYLNYQDSSNHVREEVKKLEQKTTLLDEEIAIACDLGLSLFLVPKQWVKELIYTCICDFAYKFTKPMLSYFSIKNDGIQTIKKAFDQTCWILGSQKLAATDQIEARRKKLHQEYGFNSETNRFIMQSYLHQDYTQFSLDLPLTKQVKFLQANLSKLKEKALKPVSHKMASKVLVTRKPTFSIAQVLADDSRREQISFAHDMLTLAVQRLPTSNFFDTVYQAILCFIQEDFYLPLLEVLTCAQTRVGVDTAVGKKISAAMTLLDAHVYQKVNDYQALVGSQLSFIRSAFQSLKIQSMTKIVLAIFYQSVFSFKIFTYKASHEGVLIRFSDYETYVQPGCNADNSAAICLPKLFIKGATFAQISEAVGWLASLAEGIASNEDEMIGKTFNQAVVNALLTLVKNFSGDELFKLRASMSKIVESLSKQKDSSGDLFMKTYQLGVLKDMAHMRNGQDVKKIVKKVDTQKTLWCKISTREADRKTLLSDQNKQDVQAAINEQLEIASQVEASLKTQRQEAAGKIYAYWLRKRQMIIERRRRLKSSCDQTAEQNGAEATVEIVALNSERLTYLKAVHGSVQMQRGAARVPGLYAAIDKADSLTRTLTFLLASLFVKSSLDQQFIVDKLMKVQACRQELYAFVLKKFTGSEGNSVGVIADLRERVLKLYSIAKDERELLDAWLEKSDGDQAMVDQRKQQFRKMEKWTAVFSFASTSSQKRRSVLRNFGKKNKK